MGLISVPFRAISSMHRRCLPRRCRHARLLACAPSLMPRSLPLTTPCAAPSCSETYQYYSLPFCHPPEGKEYKWEDLGEVLEGDRMVTTPYEIVFRRDVEHKKLCSQTLNAEQLGKLRTAVQEDYYFQVRRCKLPCRCLPESSPLTQLSVRRLAQCYMTHP